MIDTHTLLLRKLLDKLEVVDKKLDVLLVSKERRELEAQLADSSEEIATQGLIEHGVTFDDLPVKKKFADGFLAEMVRKHGTARVRLAMVRIQQRIAKGEDISQGHAWKALAATLGRMRDEEEIKKAEAVKERALRVMLREGEPFRIMGKNILWDGHAGQYRIDGELARGLNNPDQFVTSLARRSGWLFRPMSASAEKVLARFGMFRREEDN